uniref:Odorant receptor 40 n=1 Tax=Apriona germarii TaxID=157307 RepID=A0A7G7WND8_APRGE|nr:odorant receptor 40 [Apriona germarii]
MWLIMEIVEHVSVRIDHIKELFVDALNEGDSEEMKRKFGFAVRYHSDLLELGFYINKCFSSSMLCLILLGAAILGCASFGYMQAGSSTYLIVCACWFFGLAIICISGQHLTDESLSIGDVIYDTKWYEVGLSLRKDILFVMMRCQRPMILRAAGFGVMNYIMIVSVLRTSYSFVSLLGATS